MVEEEEREDERGKWASLREGLCEACCEACRTQERGNQMCCVADLENDRNGRFLRLPCCLLGSAAAADGARARVCTVYVFREGRLRVGFLVGTRGVVRVVVRAIPDGNTKAIIKDKKEQAPGS